MPRQDTVAISEAATIIPPPIQPAIDTRSPSHALAKSAPNAGSLPIRSETRVGLLRPIA